MKRIKFPKTYHFPWSPNLQNDDRMLQSIDQFNDRLVVATIKMDGENTSLYNDGLHARSINSKDHESRHWIKSFHAQIKNEIPENWVVCGENLFAKHSIHYSNLYSYFYAFAILDGLQNILSWNSFIEWCGLIGLDKVPLFYFGIFDREKIERNFWEYVKRSDDEVEGYVVRIADSFHYSDYNKFVGKYVRKNHVQTSEHWMSEKVVPNKLFKVDEKINNFTWKRVITPEEMNLCDYPFHCFDKKYNENDENCKKCYEEFLKICSE